MSRFRALLFDLDGTLLDTVEDIADSMNAALGRMGFPGHPARAYLHFVGEGIDQLARRALPETDRDAATVARVKGRLQWIIDYMINHPVETCPCCGRVTLALNKRKKAE